MVNLTAYASAVPGQTNEKIQKEKLKTCYSREWNKTSDQEKMVFGSHISHWLFEHRKSSTPVGSISAREGAIRFLISYQ